MSHQADAFFSFVEEELKTKAVPICESIEEKKYAKAEEVSVAGVIHYNLWIVFSIMTKGVLHKAPIVVYGTSD